MTLRLIYSRPLAIYVTSDQPQGAVRSPLLGRLACLVLEALRHSRARTAARALRRYQHLVHKDNDADKT